MTDPLRTCTDQPLEERYLGGAMCDRRVLQDHPLPSGCFGVKVHRDWHTCMVSIDLRDEVITEDRLDVELANAGHHAARARRPFSLAMPMLEDPAAICERLRALAARRSLVEGCLDAVRGLEQGDAIIAVQGRLARLAELEIADEDRTAAVRVHVIAQQALEASERIEPGERGPTITTGLPKLDTHIIGWERGEMWVLAGDSSSGKSTTMLLMGRAQAQQGERVLVVSIEDHEARWGNRSLFSAAGTPLRGLKSGDLSNSQLIAAREGIVQLRTENVWVSTPQSAPLDEVMHCIRRARAQHGITVVYLDYIQSVAHPGGDVAMRHHIMDCLEATRRETQRGETALTVCWGSQYRKRDKSVRPENEHLFEASYIEQKADAIIHVWRDPGTHDERNKGKRRWWLGKHKEEPEIEGLLIRAETGLLAAPGYVPEPKGQQEMDGGF